MRWKALGDGLGWWLELTFGHGGPWGLRGMVSGRGRRRRMCVCGRQL